MKIQRISQDSTYQDYPIALLPPMSSGQEMDFEEILDIVFANLTGQELSAGDFYESLWPFLETDLSSVHPSWKIKSETSLIGKMIEEPPYEEIFEHNITIKLPPKNKYKIQMHIKDVKKAVPKIVEPEIF